MMKPGDTVFVSAHTWQGRGTVVEVASESGCVDADGVYVLVEAPGRPPTWYQMCVVKVVE